MKKRIIGLDILRVIGVFFIFFYHFFVEYIVTAGGTNAAMYECNYFFNILARPASLFLFVISGYALMYHREDELPLGKYYLRRFKGLFIPFYVAYTLMFVAHFLVNHQMIGRGLPRRLFVYTLLGMDGVAQITAPNFYLIGEWFMTCIAACYVLFPLLARLLKRFRYGTLAVLMLWYVFLLYVHNPFAITPLMNPAFIIVYFYLGMFLEQVLGECRIDARFRRVCAVISVLIFAYFCMIGFVPTLSWLKMPPEQTEIIYFAISMTMLIALRDVELSSESGIYRGITYVSGISWYVILLHHRIMILFYQRLPVEGYTHRGIIALLLACILITWVAAIAVREIANSIRAAMR